MRRRLHGRHHAADLAAFEALARRFARTLVPGDVVAIGGPLGAGKTAFVRAVVVELHGADVATSPTFTFWHRYDGSPPIHHLDLYRIEDRAELVELGLEAAFDPAAIALVEWPERAPELLPPGAIAVAIAGSGDQPRTIWIGDGEGAA
ncbi:MAG: tRNA (adenosine(37)-N6)-threonylcarbamoyltransferase complex ATPase subunit type 1 TsaE [Vulcanimicrobiaceae bacterium]